MVHCFRIGIPFRDRHARYDRAPAACGVAAAACGIDFTVLAFTVLAGKGGPV
jgi:hypothetical protein